MPRVNCVGIDPYRFFEAVASEQEKGKERLKCQYCDYELIKRSARCIVHTIRCKKTPLEQKLKHKFVTEEDITEGSDGEQRIKDAAMVTEEQLIQMNKKNKRFSSRSKTFTDGEQTEGGSGDDGNMTDSRKLPARKSARKRKASTKLMNGGLYDSSDDEFGGAKRSKANKSEALSFLSEFLDNINGSRAGPTRIRKKFSDYTDDDWKLEERELSIRERRAKIRHLEMETKMFETQEDYYNKKSSLEERQIQLLEPISQAAQMFLSQQVVNQYNITSTNGASELKDYTLEGASEVVNADEI